MMNGHVIVIGREGQCASLWTDDLPLRDLLGPGMRVGRATDIRFNNASGKWDVVLLSTGETLFSDASRKRCAQWENDEQLAIVEQTMEKV